MQAIKTIGLTKTYKDITAVNQLSLEICQGELFSLLGMNGAGKTTTLKMLSCLVKPSGGDALISGYSIIKNPDKVKKLIAVSPQETAVAPNLSAWLSGIWFDLELVGGIFEKIANALPFVHAVEMEKALFSGNFTLAATHFIPVAIYAILTIIAAVICFIVQTKKDS